jgi:phage repressor protein C with HTH and peptisase S24 domain
MHNVAFPAVPPEEVLSSRFRVHAVTGDAMEPTLRGGRDYALLAPVTSYEGEGIYLVDIGGGTDLYRVTSAFDGAGGLLLSQEKSRGERHRLTREKFEALVVGIVVADIRVRDERFLRKSA